MPASVIPSHPSKFCVPVTSWDLDMVQEQGAVQLPSTLSLSEVHELRTWLHDHAETEMHRKAYLRSQRTMHIASSRILFTMTPKMIEEAPHLQRWIEACKPKAEQQGRRFQRVRLLIAKPGETEDQVWHRDESSERTLTCIMNLTHVTIKHGPCEFDGGFVNTGEPGAEFVTLQTVWHRGLANRSAEHRKILMAIFS